MSLQGKRIVITRADDQSSKQANLLRARGATPVLYPCIAVVPPVDINPLYEAVFAIESFDWLVFTSVNAVAMVQPRLETVGKIKGVQVPKVAAVGQRTAEAVRAHLGMEVDFIPARYTGAHLAEHLPLNGGEQVFLPQSALAQPDVVHILTARGARVTPVIAYETVNGYGGEDVPAMLHAGEIDAVTFTSSSTVTNFIERVGGVPDVLAACIGTVTAQTACSAGIRRVIAPDTFTLLHLTDLLESAL